VIGDKDHAMFRIASPPRFLSDRLTTGAVQLYDAAYRFGKRTILNLRYKDYMWLEGRSPYVRGKGDPKKDSAQWVIDGLPESG
jgi:hypothetical protein